MKKVDKLTIGGTVTHEEDNDGIFRQKVSAGELRRLLDKARLPLSKHAKLYEDKDEWFV